MNIYDLSLPSMEDYFINIGDKKFRAKQIYECYIVNVLNYLSIWIILVKF